MNSALKPVLPQPGVPQPSGQASPAKGNVAGVNHSVGHPQGAQNCLHHGTNNLAVQNLTNHPVNVPPAPAHAVPSMAPVSANMAQMAQNMSHHGNLSQVGQNSTTSTVSPAKSATTSAPLSLVQDKVTPSQPLALTRTPEKKESDTPPSQANGTVESPKIATNAPSPLKTQNPEPNKDKQDIAKTSPSTPKPPEKQSSAPSTPQKTEASNALGCADGPAQAKVVAANEAPEKSPAKPSEPKQAPTADVAPSQSDNKPAPESANDNKPVEKAATPPKPVPVTAETAKTDNQVKVEEKKEEQKVEKPEKPTQAQVATEEKKDEVKPDVTEPIKKEEKTEEKVEEKKVETPKPAKPEPKPVKSTLKLATVTTPVRKRRQPSGSKVEDGPSPSKKPVGESTPDSRSKRNRTQVQLYQSPTPELTMATKLSASAGRSTPTKPNDDKLIVFYKNEYLAVRNAEGGFYVCQAMQNVYRTTRKIKIRWLSQDKSDPTGETYKPDFYDVTDMECVLTTLSLTRGGGTGGAQILRANEAARAASILERALRAESGQDASLDLTEEHPDGLDLSLYKDESQLEKKSRKRNSSKSSPRAKSDANDNASETASPPKKARSTPKRSPRSARKAKSPQKTNNNKRKPAGSTPTVAAASKTATAVTEKPSPAKAAKSTPTKRTATKQPKVETPKVSTPSKTPKAKGRRATKDAKPSPVVPTPSTSTGKTTRTPRKPPAKK